MRRPTTTELIKRRRAQMLIHSCLYYTLDSSVIDDHTWQKWANELASLQELHKEPIGFYDEAFANWNGDTGALLPLRDSWVLSKAQHILRYHNEINSN